MFICHTLDLERVERELDTHVATDRPAHDRAQNVTPEESSLQEV